jgi:acetyl-CoA synthetase
MKTLRLLGSVGEPINPEAWMWYRSMIGHDRCPIVDTWWQTETGAIMISPMPGATPTKPGSCTRPLPGIKRGSGDARGRTRAGGLGRLSGDPQAVAFDAAHASTAIPSASWEQYWSQIPGAYFTGDGARQDEDGYIWVMGRVDDVINVSGHRLSTMEVESALVAHPKVAEAAVVGGRMRSRARRSWRSSRCRWATSDDELKEELRAWVGKEIGSLAKPDDIRFTDALPKTRSGKIMRRCCANWPRAAR